MFSLCRAASFHECCIVRSERAPRQLRGAARHRRALTPKPRLASLTGAAERPVAVGREAPYRSPLSQTPRVPPVETRALAALPSAGPAAARRRP